MRYKREIWEFFIKYIEEEQLIKYKEDIGRENVKPFFDMERDRFNRLLNTFAWLTKYNLSYINIERTVTKPTNEEILDAMLIIKENGEQLRITAKQYPKTEGEIRNNLLKMAKNRLACSRYYVKLVDENYFDKI